MTRLYIWVTSDCTLTCKWCSQKYTINQNKGYQMSMDEVMYIVNSCKRRGIHFDVIEFTGGEPSLWKHLEWGVKKFSEICDTVTLVTNGNNPDRVKSLGLKTWIVSESQATKEQMTHYQGLPNVLFNSHQHKKTPEVPFDNVLPASCCVALSPEGLPQNTVMYIKGKIYYCCNAFALSDKSAIDDCDFEDDFISRFADKKFDKEICKFCLCNNKVWSQLS